MSRDEHARARGVASPPWRRRALAGGGAAAELALRGRRARVPRPRLRLTLPARRASAEGRQVRENGEPVRGV